MTVFILRRDGKTKRKIREKKLKIPKPKWDIPLMNSNYQKYAHFPRKNT